MHPDATNSFRLAGRVARRALLADVLRRTGAALLVGAAGGVAAVGGARLAGLDWDWWWLLAAPMGICAIGSVGVSIGRRWTPMRATLEMERALALGSRVSTAMTLSAAGAVDGFEGLAIADGDRVAGSLGSAAASTVVPIRLGVPWTLWPITLALGVVAGIYLPAREWSSPDQQSSPLAADRAEVAARLAEAAQTVRETSQPLTTDSGVDQSLDEIEALERELASERTTPTEARARAASTLERAATQVEDQVEREAEADRALRERLERLAQARHADAPIAAGDSPTTSEQTEPPTGDAEPDADVPGRNSTDAAGARSGDTSRAIDAADDLRRSLESGELGTAREAVQRLRREMENLTPEQREQVAQRLRETADQLDPGRPDQPQQDQPRPAESSSNQRPPEDGDSPSQEDTGDQPRRETPGDPGGQTPTGTPPSDNPDQGRPQGTEQRQTGQGTDSRPGSEPTPSPTEREGREERSEDAPTSESGGSSTSRPDGEPPTDRERQLRERGLSEGAARDISEQSDPDQIRERLEREGMDPGAADRAARQIAEENRSRAAREQGRRQGEQDARDLSESLRRAARSLEPDQRSPGAEEPPKPGRDGEQNIDPERGEPGGRPPPSTESPLDGGRTPSPQESPQTQPSPQGSNPGPTPEARPGEGTERRTPGGTAPSPAQATDESNNADDSSDQGTGSPQDIDRALDTLERSLDRLADRERAARERLSDARRLREQADELLERTTPEQRERISRLGEELARRQRERQPAPTRFETVNASRPGEPGREQVVSEWLGEPGAPNADPRAAGVRSARIAEAAAGAQRAVEQQQVPARHADLIRRVFRRYQQSAPPRAEDAPDAPPR